MLFLRKFSNIHYHRGFFPQPTSAKHRSLDWLWIQQAHPHFVETMLCLFAASGVAELSAECADCSSPFSRPSAIYVFLNRRFCIWRFWRNFGHGPKKSTTDVDFWAYGMTSGSHLWFPDEVTPLSRPLLQTSFFITPHTIWLKCTDRCHFSCWRRCLVPPTHSEKYQPVPIKYCTPVLAWPLKQRLNATRMGQNHGSTASRAPPDNA